MLNTILGIVWLIIIIVGIIDVAQSGKDTGTKVLWIILIILLPLIGLILWFLIGRK